MFNFAEPEILIEQIYETNPRTLFCLPFFQNKMVHRWRDSVTETRPILNFIQIKNVYQHRSKIPRIYYMYTKLSNSVAPLLPI